MPLLTASYGIGTGEVRYEVLSYGEVFTERGTVIEDRSFEDSLPDVGEIDDCSVAAVLDGIFGEYIFPFRRGFRWQVVCDVDGQRTVQAQYEV